MRQKDDFEVLFKRNFKKKIISAKIKKIFWQINIAALMRPLQYYLRDPAAKGNSISIAHAAAARSNLDAAITMRFAQTELRNTIELHATASEIAAPKPNLNAKAKKYDFEALFKRNFKRKIISATIEKICWQITFVALMQPLQYDLQCPAAKDKSNFSIRHAAAAPSNLRSNHNAFCSMTWLTRMHLRTWHHQMTTIMQPFQCDLQPQTQKVIEVRTQEQPLVAEHRGGTDWPRNDPNRTRRTQEVPFIAGCSHFTRKNTRFRAPASSPKQSPCNIHAASTMRFAAWRG